ncbi:MAG: hypothetical protein H7Y41_06710 [Hyphomonadaceae bacterium]|nr:hypothetical protein [Clostridia bacterium]
MIKSYMGKANSLVKILKEKFPLEFDRILNIQVVYYPIAIIEATLKQTYTEPFEGLEYVIERLIATDVTRVVDLEVLSGLGSEQMLDQINRLVALGHVTILENQTLALTPLGVSSLNDGQKYAAVRNEDNRLFYFDAMTGAPFKDTWHKSKLVEIKREDRTVVLSPRVEFIEQAAFQEGLIERALKLEKVNITLDSIEDVRSRGLKFLPVYAVLQYENRSDLKPQATCTIVQHDGTIMLKEYDALEAFDRFRKTRPQRTVNETARAFKEREDRYEALPNNAALFDALKEQLQLDVEKEQVKIAEHFIRVRLTALTQAQEEILAPYLVENENDFTKLYWDMSSVDIYSIRLVSDEMIINVKNGFGIQFLREF